MAQATAFFSRNRALQRLPLWSGAIVSAFATLVLIAWFAHWKTVIQVLPNLAPMKFNTALCLLCCGASLMLLDTKGRKMVGFLGGVIALIAGLTLLEYFTAKNFKLDELFVRDFVHMATTFPGRMSPLAATSFLFVAMGLICAVTDNRTALMTAGLLASAVMVIGIVALFGYFVGIEAAYGWGAYTRMAMHTALAFVIVSAGLLVWAWQTSLRMEFNFLHWLPVTASLTLMAMIAFVSSVTFAQLRRSSEWRKHSYQVILEGRAFMDDIFATQRGMRNFVLTSQSLALDIYNSGATNAPVKLAELQQLTLDNPRQQLRLKELTVDLADLLNYSRTLITTRSTRGLEAAVQMESDGHGFAIIRQLTDHLKAFTDTEEQLLNERSIIADTDFHNTGRLFILGSILAAALLVFANWMARREMAFRREAQRTQARLAGEIKRLLESTGEGIYGVDLNGCCTFINPSGARMIGYQPDEPLGKNMHDLIHHTRENGSPYPVAECPMSLAFKSNLSSRVDSEVFWRKDGTSFKVEYSSFPIVEGDVIQGAVVAFTDITERRKHETEREQLIAELQKALTEVKTLSGFIPICGWCKNVRSDQGFWQSVEQYLRSRTDARFSHGMCPTCAEKFKAEVAKANAPGPAKN